MKKHMKRYLICLGLLALIIALPPDAPVQGKRDFLEQLELLHIAYMIGQYEEPFTKDELEQLQRAAPDIKANNPKLYKDRDRTEKILILYMVLEEIAQADKNNSGLRNLVGKSRGELARNFVKRVYRAN